MDIFDTMTEEKPQKRDIFDDVAPSGDVFDQVDNPTALAGATGSWNTPSVLSRVKSAFTVDSQPRAAAMTIAPPLAPPQPTIGQLPVKVGPPPPQPPPTPPVKPPSVDIVWVDPSSVNLPKDAPVRRFKDGNEAYKALQGITEPVLVEYPGRNGQTIRRVMAPKPASGEPIPFAPAPTFGEMLKDTPLEGVPEALTRAKLLAKVAGVAVADKVPFVRAQRDLATGFISVGSNMAAAVPFFAGGDSMAGKLGMKLANKADSLAKAISPDDVNFLDKLGQGLGSAATFMVPGLGVARGAGAVAQAGAIGARLAPYLGLGLSSFMEASSEAGGKYKDLRDRGLSEADAHQNADANFWGNMLALAITNKLGGVFDGAQVSAIKKAIMSAPMEGIQEVVQDMIADFTDDKPFDWKKSLFNKKTLETFGIGAIIGGAMGAAASEGGPEEAGKAIAPAVSDQIDLPTGGGGPPDNRPPGPPGVPPSGPPPPPPGSPPVAMSGALPVRLASETTETTAPIEPPGPARLGPPMPLARPGLSKEQQFMADALGIEPLDPGIPIAGQVSIPRAAVPIAPTETETAAPAPTDETAMQAAAKTAGAIYRGIQVDAEGKPDFVLVNDPLSRTTLAVPLDQMTPEAIQAKLKESRAKLNQIHTPQAFAESLGKAAPQIPVEQVKELTNRATAAADDWAKQTGRPATDFFKTKFAGIFKGAEGGEEGVQFLGNGRALVQISDKSSVDSITGALDQVFTNKPKAMVGSAYERGSVDTGMVSEVAKKLDTLLRLDKGVGPKIDALNDVRVGRIMETAFDAPTTGKAVKAYMDKVPSDGAKEAIYKFLHGQGPIDLVPEEIRPAVQKMRVDVDNLSRKVANFGTKSEGLRDVIYGNLGKYLGRYYKMFEAKEYTPSPEVVERAKAKLREMNPNTIGTLSDDQMEGVIQNILDRKNGTFFRGDKRIDIPQNHFVKRKSIPPEIRALYGEIKDPVYLYLKTMADMSTVAHNGEFLATIKDVPGAFMDTPDSKHVKQLPSTKAWGPVGGKYVDQDLYNFLIEQIDPTESPLSRALTKFIVNPFKWTKTVGSIPSHPRNFLGNIMFSVLAGNSVTNPLNAPHYAKALEVMLTKEGKSNEIWKEMLRGRVVGGQYWGSEMPKMIKELISDPVNYSDKVLEMAQKPIEWLGELYNNEDLVYRVSSYLKYKSQGMTPEQAAVETNKWFTDYAKVPKLTDTIRTTAMFGPFFSFKSNVVRILYNAGKQGVVEAKAGNPTRLIALTFALAVPSLISQLSRKIHDVDDDEIKKLNKVLPDYRKHGNVVYYRDDKGALKAFDLTYIWPTGDFERAIRALGAGDVKSFGDTLNLFAHPVFDAYAIALQNVDPYRKEPISNVNDPIVKQVKDRAAAILRSIYLPASSPIPDVGALQEGKLKPGLLTGYQIKNLIDAYNGVANKWGQTRDFKEEVKNFMTGVRTWTVRPDRLVGNYINSKRGEFLQEQRDVRQWFRNNPSADAKAKADRKQLADDRIKKIMADVKEAEEIKTEVLDTTEQKGNSNLRLSRPTAMHPVKPVRLRVAQ